MSLLDNTIVTIVAVAGVPPITALETSVNDDDGVVGSFCSVNVPIDNDDVWIVLLKVTTSTPVFMFRSNDVRLGRVISIVYEDTGSADAVKIPPKKLWFMSASTVAPTTSFVAPDVNATVG